MVREAYSAGGQPQQAESGAAAQPLDSAANLTQELALLLAQSAGQPGIRPPGNGATGSELANLAALVSASQGQRPMQPSFRDGLSSLTYARPAHQPLPPPPPSAPAPVAVAAASPPIMPVGPALMPVGAGLMPASGGSLMPMGGGLLVTEPHDEEPMPIPSTWRQPMTNDDDRWYRQQLGAAGLGLLAGLVVVVPAVLWLSGWIGGTPKTATAARQQPAAEAPSTGPVAQVKVRFNTASAEARTPAAEPSPRAPAAPEPRISVAVAPPAEPAPRQRAIPEPPVVAALPPAVLAPPRVELAPPARSRTDELLSQARRLIENRDIVAARDLLQAAETSSSGPLIFTLAETYDPSMLAIWQVKPDGVIANPERARALYARARDLGDTRAQQRIEWLR